VTSAARAPAEAWLAEHQDGATPAEALVFFDSLPAVAPAEIVGRWRGRGLHTGSPLDGLLEAYGWYGKEVSGVESAHPLLFSSRSGPRPVDPALMPLALLRDHAGLAHHPLLRTAFGGIRPFFYTNQPKARLRMIEHRGVATAALVYDALPIIDVLRRVSDDVLLGAMDMRGLAAPFFFVLRRD